MAVIGWVILLVFMAIVVYVIYIAMRNSNPREGYLGRVARVEDIRTGEKYLVDVDISHPENIINVDDNTGKEYIWFKPRGFFQKSQKHYLSENHLIITRETHTDIYDGIDYVNNILTTKLSNLTRDLIEERGEKDKLEVQLMRLKGKTKQVIENERKVIADFHKDLYFLPAFGAKKKS